MSNRQKAPNTAIISDRVRAELRESYAELREFVDEVPYVLRIGATAVTTVVLSVPGTVVSNLPSDPGYPSMIFVQSDAPNVSGLSTESFLGMNQITPFNEMKVALSGVRFNLLSEYHTLEKVGGEWVIVMNEQLDQQEAATAIQEMEYARGFDKDPAARRTVDQGLEIANSAEVIQDFINQDYEVSVTVQGFASPEDDQADASAGLNMPNEKNQALADERGIAGGDLLSEHLDNKGLSGKVQINVLPGVEVFDEVLSQKIAEIAEAHGETARSVTQLYNSDQLGLFTEDELEVLGVLDEYRKVEIRVTATKVVEVPELKYIDGVLVESTKKQVERSVVIILIPMMRRRRKSGDESSGSSASDKTKSGNGHRATVAVNALGIPYNPSARRGAIFTADNSVSIDRPGALSPGAVEAIKVAVDGQSTTQPLIVPFVPLVEATPIPVAPVTIESGANGEFNRPPKNIGKVANGDSSPTGHNKQPTWSNDGADEGVNRKGRNRKSAATR